MILGSAALTIFPNSGSVTVRSTPLLSAFAADTGLVLAHIEIDEKSNEIPAMQKLLQELGLADHIVTADAIHCQKNF